MLCRQCEEACAPAGCTKIGICGKTEELSASMDTLIGTLIELAACGKTDSKVDEVIVDGLFMTLSNTNFDISRIISTTEVARELIGSPVDIRVPDIISLDKNDDLRSLKELLLFGLKGMAAYYHHARVLGAEDARITGFIRKALASLAEPLTAEQLVSLNME